jgi:chromosome partitioning protein
VAKVIALFNQAGGVSKTSLTMNLGYHLAQRKHRVLLVDMDPQASLTTFMGLDVYALSRTVYEAVVQDEEMPIHSDIHGMDLAPANLRLSGAELELVVADMRDIRLKDALAPLLETYDFILIDCPPSLGILSYISLVAATHTLIPIQTHYKSLIGADLLLDTISRVRVRANKALKIAGIVPTMHEAQTVQAKMSLQTIEEQLSKLSRIYPPIPRSIAFADASQEHVPLAIFAPKHPAIEVLQIIAQGLEELS